MKPKPRILALAGGVGGAKLVAGLAPILKDRLTVLVNTGDDFEHLGFHVSPDIDTVMYTLAGIANPRTGWGVANETWSFMDQVGRLGGPTWFNLGDRDVAVHALRTSGLRRGETLTSVTAELCRSFNLQPSVLPMTNDPVRTIIHSDKRTIAFQEYFVGPKCEAPVRRLTYRGTESAKFNPRLCELPGTDQPLVTIICPSNPYLSIDPILSLPGLKEWITETSAAIVAVSPIVGDDAIKGPAAKIMRELGIEPSAAAVARHYDGLIDGFVLDTIDAKYSPEIEALGVEVISAQTIMVEECDRIALARTCLDFAECLISPRKA